MKERAWPGRLPTKMTGLVPGRASSMSAPRSNPLPQTLLMTQGAGEETMRAADDFAAIRARMEQLQREREAGQPKHHDTSWRVQRVPIDEIERVVQEKTRELLRRR